MYHLTPVKVVFLPELNPKVTKIYLLVENPKIDTSSFKAEIFHCYFSRGNALWEYDTGGLPCFHQEHNIVTPASTQTKTVKSDA